MGRTLTSAFVKGLAAGLPLTNLVTLHYGEYQGTPALPRSEYIVIVNAAKSN